MSSVLQVMGHLAVEEPPKSKTDVQILEVIDIQEILVPKSD